MRLAQLLDQLVDRGIVDGRVDRFDPNVVIRARIDLRVDRNDNRERQWLARADVDARIANRHQIFTLERLPVEIGHEKAVGFLQKTSGPYICSIIAFGAFPFGSPAA